MPDLRGICISLGVMLICSSVVVSNNDTVYATHPTNQIIGMVTPHGCSTIGGKVEVNALTSDHSQTIRVCKQGERYYEILAEDNTILGHTGCILVLGSGTDPVTGKSYVFGDPCDVPRGCEASGDWGGNLAVYSVHELNIRIKDKDFVISVGEAGLWCTFKEFSIDQKAFRFDAINRKTLDNKTLIDVAVPNELLSGEFTVLVNGQSRDFETREKDGYTIISLELQGYGDRQRIHVEVIGTKVIPELPFALVALGSTIAVLLAFSRLTKKQNSI